MMEMSDYLVNFSNKIDTRSLRISVVGLGYVGLPTALAFHKAGFHVTGIDVSESVILSLADGSNVLLKETSYSIPTGDKWHATSDFGDNIFFSDVVIVCVPTPVDSSMKPDLTSVRSALTSIIESKDPERKLTIIMESTVQPGTTRNSIVEIIGNQDIEKAGIMISYCPERVSPGEGEFGVEKVGRVIGSDYPELTEILASLYNFITIGGVTPVDSVEIAEASKLVENAQRDIDIAFVNELSILLPKLGLDVEKVLEAADTKWNFHRHTPGLGVGGHCIPIDPHYYIEIAERYGVNSALSPAARSLNSSMPSHSAREIVTLCGSQPDRVLVLGYSYKPNISDTRETPVIPLIEELYSSGSNKIFVWDPLVESENVQFPAEKIDDLYSLDKIDCLVVATSHDCVLGLDWGRLKEIMPSPKIFDSRRCIDGGRLRASGWDFHAIGMPRNLLE